MGKWIAKLLLGAVVFSFVCFYAGGAMAMSMEVVDGDMEHCDHCYVQDVLDCSFGEVVVPGHEEDCSLEACGSLLCFDLEDSFEVGFYRGIIDVGWLAHKDRSVNPPFISSKVVLLI